LQESNTLSVKLYFSGSALPYAITATDEEPSEADGIVEGNEIADSNVSGNNFVWLNITDQVFSVIDFFFSIDTTVNGELDLDNAAFASLESVNVEAQSNLETINLPSGCFNENYFYVDITNNPNLSADSKDALIVAVYNNAITHGLAEKYLYIDANSEGENDYTETAKFNALVASSWNDTMRADTINISNKEELAAISLYLSGSFEQINDIDLDGAGAVWKDVSDNIVSAPTPDGYLYVDKSICNNYYEDAVIGGTFTGLFDGNGYKIINMAIKQQEVDERYCGLFEQGNDCSITRTEVSGKMQAAGASIDGYAGGLIGHVIGSSATISTSVSNVDCLSGSRVGGFVGLNNYSATITDCYSTGNVSSSGDYSGGFVGHNNLSAAITTSFSYGLLSGAGGSKGGFCGQLDDATFSDCYWNSTGQPAGLTDIGLPKGDNDDITALTAEEFRNSGNFDGWDFINIWSLQSIKTFEQLGRYVKRTRDRAIYNPYVIIGYDDYPKLRSI
jgi:hypothetical protein